MSQQEAIKLFDSKRIRTVWDEDQEKWFFSIVDVIAVLTESANPRTYWKVLKNRLAKEGNESVTNCNQLKLQAAKRFFEALQPKLNLPEGENEKNNRQHSKLKEQKGLLTI